MKRIVLLLALSLYSISSLSQNKEHIEFGASFAHFDDTDGIELNIAYTSMINRYLGYSLNVNYAKTNDFAKKYTFSGNMHQNYWFTKSTIFNFSPLMHFHFIHDKKHDFSFYAGLGIMLIDAIDNSNQFIGENNYMFESSIETYTTISKTIGIKYIYFMDQFGIGLNLKLFSTLKENDKYFGQDNYRSVGLLIIKKI